MFWVGFAMVVMALLFIVFFIIYIIVDEIQFHKAKKEYEEKLDTDTRKRVRDYIDYTRRQYDRDDKRNRGK